MTRQVRFPSEIRRELLEQHRGLRVLIEDGSRCARDVLAGDRDTTRLDEAARKIKAALLAHNASEEAALSPLLMGIDAFGPERVERLLAHHKDEHHDLLGALDSAAGSVTGTGTAQALLDTFARLIDHMDGEESEELSAAVLRDDVVSIDAAGG
jgi:hypothetical protein